MALGTLIVQLAQKYKIEKKTELGQDHYDRIAILVSLLFIF